MKQVDELDDRVSELERVVKELEEWTGELGKAFFNLTRAISYIY